MKKVILALICLLPAVLCQARTITIEADGSGDYYFIQEAIDDSNDGDIIILNPGIYTDKYHIFWGNVNIDFQGKAITVRSIDPNDPAVVAATVIDGEAEANRGDCIFDTCEQLCGFYFRSGEGPNSVLAGLTITRFCGGGIHLEQSSPTITHCTINDTCEHYLAGGIYSNGGSPTISHCTIINNYCTHGTGGIYCSSGGTITNCIISGNMGGAWGGGIGGSPNKIENCIISNNEVVYHGRGGGIYISGNPTMTTISQCTITNNFVLDMGGMGGGVYGNPIITNCILWANNSPNGPEISGSPEVSYSDIQGAWPGTGNINADPCFADPNNDDYHLKSQAGRWDPNTNDWVTGANTSPCIDAGDPNSDWTAEPRPHGGRINMGAYGGTNEASMSPGCFPGDHPDYDEWVRVGRPECWCYPRQCHGDADGKYEGGTTTGYYYVGMDDLNVLVAAWEVLEDCEEMFGSGASECEQWPGGPPTPNGPGIASVTGPPPDYEPGICADFSHSYQGGTTTGYYYVGMIELNIMVPNWEVLENCEELFGVGSPQCEQWPGGPATPTGDGINPNCLE